MPLTSVASCIVSRGFAEKKKKKRKKVGRTERPRSLSIFMAVSSALKHTFRRTDGDERSAAGGDLELNFSSFSKYAGRERERPSFLCALIQ